jgi:hypothetical protein
MEGKVKKRVEGKILGAEEFEASTGPIKVPEQVAASAQRGWCLFPTRDRFTEPLVKHWQARATTDLALLKAWANMFPGCNWGMATGATSGVMVIEVEGEDARTSITRLKSLGFKFPKTLSVLVGPERGDVHRYYRPPVGADIDYVSRCRLGRTVKLKGDNGYTQIPPSRGVAGMRYKFLDPDQSLADMPEWMVSSLSWPRPRGLQYQGVTKANANQRKD